MSLSDAALQKYVVVPSVTADVEAPPPPPPENPPADVGDKVTDRPSASEAALDKASMYVMEASLLADEDDALLGSTEEDAWYSCDWCCLSSRTKRTLIGGRLQNAATEERAEKSNNATMMPVKEKMQRNGKKNRIDVDGCFDSLVKR
jgi:hypothetical protein